MIKKIFKKFLIAILVIGIFICGLYTSEWLIGLRFIYFIWGFASQTCNLDLLTKWDKKIFSFNEYKVCFGFCCDEVLIYLFYLTILTPIATFLFLKKQKLPAILFASFGIGIILGTFIFFLIMP